MFHVEHFADVIVIGGGHAGIEAAAAAHRLGLKVRLISLQKSTIGALSCNPAVGGTAKGQVVKEIDALGGLMGEITDECSLQFKMLNKSKGRAVWSPRSQVSRSKYPIVAQRRLSELDAKMIVEDSIRSIWIESGRIKGVISSEGCKYPSKAVIVCAGTFLNGVMHTGLNQTSGGRFGEAPAFLNTEPAGALALITGRLKTGTPPRISMKSINTDVLEFQEGDDRLVPFSNRGPGMSPNAIKCWITYTNKEAHKEVENGFSESPMFQGRIQGKGPRYCPSIEDKITRFAEKEQHHIFLEPEEADGDVIYVNGFSTSLPANIQINALRKMKGLENVELLRPGYAVEYDYFPAYQLKPTLESKEVEGLYFAGQVNGTSGYEEAAAQGIVAGINAGGKILGKDDFVLTRSEAYIGVLIDDLITKTQEEPYRLFTASAEHRLLLRQDTADLRLSEKAWNYGLIKEEEWKSVQAKKKALSDLLDWTDTERVTIQTEPLKRESLRMAAKSGKVNLTKYAKQNYQPPINEEIVELAETEIMYEGYIRQHEAQISRIKEQDARSIPAELRYDNLTALSLEAREVLKKFRPVKLSHAASLPGVTPADLSILMVALKNNDMFHVEHS